MCPRPPAHHRAPVNVITIAQSRRQTKVRSFWGVSDGRMEQPPAGDFLHGHGDDVIACMGDP
jgi:hypothetical protein